MTVALGDFNVQSKNWYKHDKTLHEGAKLESLAYTLKCNKLYMNPHIF